MARDGPATVFVEVKARATAEFGTAAEAVTPLKQRRLESMALDYLARHRLLDRPCRFDVVAVDGLGEQAVITVYRVRHSSRGERRRCLDWPAGAVVRLPLPDSGLAVAVTAGGPGERE